MDELLAASEAERRFVLILFEAFGLVALALAATGIYGVLSGGVAERMREMGVRTAFGATRADNLGLVLRQGMRLSAFGAAIGLGGSILASYALKSLLFNVSNLDPLTYLAVTGLLFGVAGIACLLPARRAAMLDPLEALRAD
jgi:ABC-type antimicrobial peptide transport system permease subunit